ncbi:MAG: outer membrane beta-barrel family protein [Christiangramia sp.]
MKKFIALLIKLLLQQAISAQDSVSGSISSEGEVVPFATISVYESGNPENILGYAYSDENGLFEILLKKTSEIAILKAESMGFEDYTREIRKTELPLKNLKINLQISSDQLDEVELVADGRKAVKLDGDKMIFDIEKAGIAGAGNGLQVMQQIPGISLDQNQNIQFRGSSGVKILINGKTSFLKGEALREFVSSLTGEDIAKVEIIAQPSSRYEAEGTTGIINIVLKKGRKQGITGRTYTSFGYGEFYKWRNGANLYYSDSLWNVNVSGYYNESESINDRKIEQDIFDKNYSQKIIQTNLWLPRNFSRSLSLGVERTLPKNQSISTSWRYNSGTAAEQTNGETREFRSEELYKKVLLDKKADIPTRTVTGNVFYQNSWNEDQSHLEAQLNFSRYDAENSILLRNSYPVNPEGREMLVLNTLNQTTYDIYSGQLDFSTQFSEKMSLETGWKWSQVRTDYLNNYEANDPSQLLVAEELLDNRFQYHESLLGAYGQLSYALENWNFLAGLRAEYINYEGVSKNSENGAKYTAWFPSFSANYEAEEAQYQFSYSRRIGRPDYKDLNPFYEYLDPYTLQRGNTNLQPQFYHSFQFNYSHNNMVTSLYGYFYKDKITRVIDFDREDNFTNYYQANAARGHNLGISFSAPYKPFGWWKIQFDASGYHSYEKSEIPGYAYDHGGFGYDLSIYQNFDLENDWKLNFNAFYSGASESGNTRFFPAYDLDLNVQKQFWNNRLKAEFSARQILKRSRWHSIMEQDDVRTDWLNQWETRVFALTLTYNFGNQKTRDIKEASLSEEKSRM